MAMPLFILTAEIISRAGVTRSLIDFAMSILSRFKGGMGHVNILTSVFFAGIPVSRDQPLLTVRPCRAHSSPR